VYGELFPQLNLRQWSGVIYTWLTQPGLDPARSGRVTMDYLMKLVTTALEWSYEAGDTEVAAETLEKAAELLVLRRNTLRLIDGAGPSVEAPPSESTGVAQASETEAEQVDQNQDERVACNEVQSGKKPFKCTFSGVVHIDLQQFLGSGIPLIECPDCTSTSSLSPHNGILRFKSHNKRKTRSLSTEPRWAKRETIWTVVGG
jgi:hypothetical protein